MIPYTENKKGNELDPITIGNDKYVLIAHPSTGVLYKCLVSELVSFVGVGGGNFIPLAGTTAPVTGDIEIDCSGGYKRIFTNSNGQLRAISFGDDGSFEINAPTSNIQIDENLTFQSTDLASKGISGGLTDYTQNIGDLDYPQKKYVDGVIEVGSDTNEYIKRKDASGSFYWVPVLRALP